MKLLKRSIRKPMSNRATQACDQAKAQQIDLHGTESLWYLLGASADLNLLFEIADSRFNSAASLIGEESTGWLFGPVRNDLEGLFDR